MMTEEQFNALRNAIELQHSEISWEAARKLLVKAPRAMLPAREERIKQIKAFLDGTADILTTKEMLVFFPNLDLISLARQIGAPYATHDGVKSVRYNRVMLGWRWHGQKGTDEAYRHYRALGEAKRNE